MRKLLFIISISLNIVTFSQNKLSLRKMKKIEKYSTHLTGEWKYLGSYKNGKKISDSSDYVYMNFEHLGSENNFSLHKIIFEFEKNGEGYYEEIFEHKNGNIMGLPHEPIPQIIFKKGKYIIKMTEMLGTYSVFFRVKKHILILKRENQDFEKKYKRI